LNIVGIGMQYVIRISDQLSDGSMFVVSSSSNKLYFSVLNANTLTHVQTIDDFEVQPIFYLTKNGRFIAVTFNYYRQEILVFRYS
jgi:hypothetical protein